MRCRATFRKNEWAEIKRCVKEEGEDHDIFHMDPLGYEWRDSNEPKTVNISLETLDALFEVADREYLDSPEGSERETLWHNLYLALGNDLNKNRAK